MGYETKLLIGSSSSLTGQEAVYGDLIIEDGEAYRPMKKDDDGNFLHTDKKETWFQIMATIDLCKCGYDTAISKIDRVNTDESHQWHWYNGEERTIEDNYGDKLKPVKISLLVDALKKDLADDSYRRFKWALALLESMADDKEGLTVLMYGH